MNWLNNIVRPEMLSLVKYSSARNEYTGSGQVQLDANESAEQPYGQRIVNLNRYPEPQPIELKRKLAAIYGVNTEQLLLTRGVDEGIDLLIRTFCTPYKDAVVIMPPTYGYYQVAANINGVGIVKVPLLENFVPDWAVLLNTSFLAAKLSSSCDFIIEPGNIKIIFLCTPNNPTGSLISTQEIKTLCQAYNSRTIIAVDEAYIEFADAESATTLLSECSNLVVLRTLSKAYGLAGVRLGAVIAAPTIIELLGKVIAPYPIATLCAVAAITALTPLGLTHTKKCIANVKSEREYVSKNLLRSPKIKCIYKSSANFLLIIAANAESLYQELKSQGIIVRKRTHDIPEALRITIGTEAENDLLLAALNLVQLEKNPIRHAYITRKTKETEAICEVWLDTVGGANVNTGIGFFDHMLEQLACHSGISIDIQAIGDINVDAHHTVEDVAIILGLALKEALGTKFGINRYGFANRYGFVLPMDESEAKVIIDLSGRGCFCFTGEFKCSQVGTLPTTLIKHFFATLSSNLGAAIHITVIGDDDHHMIEAIFKCVAKTLQQAIAINSSQLPSTKELLI
jgi:histidinol-phosphate aminotransferase